jgi:hypothetical protein
MDPLLLTAALAGISGLTLLGAAFWLVVFRG